MVMNDRDKRTNPGQDRAERLAAALRANLKRRKAQARGRHDREAAGQDENRPASSHSESKDK
jgi:hypothetical protein